MADRADPEIPHVSADELKVAVPQVAESPSTLEISSSVLDVHAPHRAVHTWKDFFIHIATIVIGLLIAIGLEQTVEHFHHRHQAQEARKRLLEEVKANGEIAERNGYAVRMHEKHLREALLVLDRARNHALLPTDHIVTARRWRPVAATQAIGRAAMVINEDLIERNAALPPVETGVYFGEKGESAAEEALMLRSAGAPQISRLTPAQAERLEQGIQSSIYDDEMLLNDCRHLTEQAKETPGRIHAD
jgi:DNA-binding CsgD family transcriptional regulator